MKYSSVLSYRTDANGFDDAQFSMSDGNVSLSCKIGDSVVAVIQFEGVIALRFANEPYAAVCPTGAVDGVVVDNESEWKKGAAGNGKSLTGAVAGGTRHFLTFISNVGLLEVLAQNVSAMPGR